MITDEQIKQGLDKSYKEAGHNAYFGNGFKAGVKFALEQVKNFSIPDVSQRLMVGSKVCFIAHKNITGVIVDRSDIGFNHWMVKWDRTGRIVREYGADLVVC